MGKCFNGISETDMELIYLFEKTKSLQEVGSLSGYKHVPERFMQLCHNGFLGVDPATSDWVLLPSAQIALEEYIAFKVQQEKAIKCERFRYWFPIIISNIIAASALVTSIIAILK